MKELKAVCGRYTLLLNAETGAFAVEFMTDGIPQRWETKMRPYIYFNNGETFHLDRPLSAEPYVTGVADGFRLTFGSFENSQIVMYARIYFERITADLHFEFELENDEPCSIEHVEWPAAFEFDGEDAEYTFLPRMQGTLIPAGERVRLANGFIYDRDGSMPVYGQKRRLSGYTAIFDTPYDARYFYDDESHIRPHWAPSLGRMAYRRSLIIRFDDHWDYNRLARVYRAYVKERGALKTLAEKEAKNPNLARLYGCPVIHTSISRHISEDSRMFDREHPEHNHGFHSFYERADQLRALSAKGLRHAYTHFDGWGRHGYDNLHPSPFPPSEEAGGAAGMKELADTARKLGYIFGIHDQYRDYYYDGPDFSFENAVTDENGNHPYCDTWDGGKHSYLCSALAPDYVRRNYDEFERLGIRIEASYLDVFSVTPMDECFHPDHKATRAECAAHRRHCLDLLSDRGIIPSSEEVLDCILPAQTLCHYAPFNTSYLGADPGQYTVGIAVPVLSLVYHDCVVIPWWCNGSLDEHATGIPEGQLAYPYAVLLAGPVYCPIDADEATIAEVTAISAHAGRLAKTELLRHEFLSDDRAVQRTTYADGTVVEANVVTGAYTVTYGNGEKGPSSPALR